MENMLQDTIAAIATPPGTGGVGIIRISGHNAFKIIQILTNRTAPWPPYSLTPATIYDTVKKEPLDQVIIGSYHAPHSYTGENTIEINCHGSYFLTNKLLTECLQAGARLAKPGEFTRRAFLNGKLDLTQVEAVAEMIGAKSDLSAQLALKHLKGSISRQIAAIRQTFMQLYAEIEASVDFPEEMQEPQKEKIKHLLKTNQQEIALLLRNSAQGLMIKEGLKIVLVGQTNAGKSSIFNALLKEEKAIVTEIHGTTRDAIEAEVDLHGIRATLIDTAGIRESQDKIETLGIQKSQEFLKTADLVLYIVDASKGLTAEDQAISEQVKEKPLIFVLNKIDLAPDVKLKDAVNVSAQQEKGLDKLKTVILKLMDLYQLDISKQTYISSLRQQEILIRVNNAIAEALNLLDEQVPLDILTIDLKKIIVELGEITGDEVSEETIDYIFKNFCVGK